MKQIIEEFIAELDEEIASDRIYRTTKLRALLGRICSTLKSMQSDIVE